MSDTPGNESLGAVEGSRRGWGHLLFFLGFFSGFLIALIINERGDRKAHTEKSEHAAVSESAPRAEEHEDVRAPESHEAESHVSEARPSEESGKDHDAPAHEMEITKATRDRLLTVDFLDLLQDAELHRYRFEGETKGVKLTKIRTGSIYQKAGFHDGDIIEQINGIAVADIEKKPMKAKQELPAANSVEFLVRRDDKVIKIRVKVAGYRAE